MKPSELLVKFKNRNTLILLVIMILSVGFMTYIGYVNKPILGGDELSSFISANQSTGNRLKFWSRSWYDGRLYLDAYSVHPGEEFQYEKVWLNQADDAHPPLWYAVIHTICSFFPGQFSKWFTLIINILCIPFAILLVYKNVLLLTERNENLALLSSFIYGISTGTVKLVLFLRMYTMLQLWCLLILYLHLKNVKEERLQWYDYVLIGAGTLLGALTHYYFLAFLFVLAVCFGIYLLKNKRFKETILYCVTMAVTAGLSIAIYPAMLKHIFGGYRGDETMNNLKGDLVGFIESFKTVTNAVLTDIFGNVVVGAIILGTLIVVNTGMGLYTVVRRNQNRKNGTDLQKEQKTNEQGTETRLAHKTHVTRMIVTLITLVVYYLVIVKATPIRDFRYFAPIYPMIIIFTVLGLYSLLQKVITNKTVIYITLLLVGILPTAIYLIRETPVAPTEAAVVAEEYKDCDAILALRDPSDGVTNYITLSNYYQMSKYSKFYIIYETELDPLDDETLKNEERLVVTIYDVVDKDAIMNYLKDYTGLSQETYLYCGDEGDTKTYLLTRN